MTRMPGHRARPPLVRPRVQWNGLHLKSTRYMAHGDFLVDDGIIDDVAILRVVQGFAVRMTLREAVCAVYELNRLGCDDAQIAARMQCSREWVNVLRRRHGIPSISADQLAIRYAAGGKYDRAAAS